MTTWEQRLGHLRYDDDATSKFMGAMCFLYPESRSLRRFSASIATWFCFSQYSIFIVQTSLHRLNFVACRRTTDVTVCSHSVM